MVGGSSASFATAPADLRFAVAAFADVLRNSQDAEHWSLAQIRELAHAAAGNDPDRHELVGLIDRAIRLRTPDSPRAPGIAPRRRPDPVPVWNAWFA